MTALSWIGSLWSALSNITGPLYVWINSKMDDRYTIAVGGFMCVLGLMLASITNEVYQLYLTQGVIFGLGASLLWYPCMRRPMEWFKKKRGLAVGITLSGIGIGGLILSNIASAAIASVGYQWTLRIFGFIELVLCAIAGISSKQLPPRPKSAPILDLAVFKNKWFLVLFSVHFIVAFAFFIPTNYIPLYAEYIGLDTLTGTNLNGLMSGCLSVGQLFFGNLGDYIGLFNMSVICGFLCVVFHLALWLPATSAPILWAFAALQGIAQGAFNAMIVAVIVDCAGDEEADSGTGWAFFGWIVGALLGPPLASAIMNHSEVPDYPAAIGFAAALFFLATCLMLVLRVKFGGWKLLKVV
ncbi:MFS general substrate transporter [Lichtheimia hyalospora FSU 10163]|nr:MFS general substrate transporter [Lichtheimia hyalospora FSU 10163]